VTVNISRALKTLHVGIVCVITVVLSRNALGPADAARKNQWHSSCKQSLQRAESALVRPAPPTQIAQRIRDLPDDYKKAETRDVVHFIVSNWSAREDLQSAFANESGELNGEAMHSLVEWT
jgi:hypothetical protein